MGSIGTYPLMTAFGTYHGPQDLRRPRGRETERGMNDERRKARLLLRAAGVLFALSLLSGSSRFVRVSRMNRRGS